MRRCQNKIWLWTYFQDVPISTTLSCLFPGPGAHTSVILTWLRIVTSAEDLRRTSSLQRLASVATWRLTVHVQAAGTHVSRHVLSFPWPWSTPTMSPECWTSGLSTGMIHESQLWPILLFSESQRDSNIGQIIIIPQSHSFHICHHVTISPPPGCRGMFT